MKEELFDSILTQLAELNFSGRVGFHVNNDPLIVPGIEIFVGKARRALPNAWLQILTNGRALKNSLGEKLLDAGINELSINWYAEDLEKPLPPHILSFQNDVLANRFSADKIGSGHGPGLDRSLFRYNVFRRKINAVLTNRAGTAPNKSCLTSDNELGFCIYPFTQLNVTANGRVSKCCADVGFEDPMGDLTSQTVFEVWNSDRFRQVRSALLRNRRQGLSQCGVCDFLGIRPVEGKMRWMEELGFLSLAPYGQD